ncbi:MAG: response regulator [Oscillatoriaceae cyanobacterium Prado104]|nr:response regulator [Oscillatoriaceae cyanobacterium Prado104]
MSYANCSQDLEPSYKNGQVLANKVPLVLAVDDNRDNLDLLTQILDLWGCKCVGASDGCTALAAAFDRTPDLIVLDICLPDIDGIELIARLKAEPTLANVPIIAITALAKTEDRDRILLAGCVAYLSKPFNLDDLEIIMRSQLKLNLLPVDF